VPPIPIHRQVSNPAELVKILAKGIFLDLNPLFHQSIEITTVTAEVMPEIFWQLGD
jgi:hypothetical protein